MFTSRRHDDLKEMLDSNKDSLKLEAMKRIVAVSINIVYCGWGRAAGWKETGCICNNNQHSS